MNGKTKSILLQVAFKEAAARGEDVAATKLLTSQFYVLLQELHGEIGIDPDEGQARGGGGGGRNFPAKPRMATPTSAIPFATADGTTWLDYRTAKINNEVKANFPDFKTSDGKTSVWAYDRDGTPVAEAAELTAAADSVAALTAPM
jgi:hypothetical protein